MSDAPKYMGNSDVAKRYGLSAQAVSNMQNRSAKAKQGQTARGTERKMMPVPGGPRDTPFPEPDMVIGNTKGWTPGTMDQHMAKRGYHVVQHDQFGPLQDAFGVVPQKPQEP